MHLYSLNTFFVVFVGSVKPHNLRTVKIINNKRSHLQVSKPRIQMSTNISVSVNPQKLPPMKKMKPQKTKYYFNGQNRIDVT